MWSMRSTLLLAGLLAIAPFISATPTASHSPRKHQCHNPSIVEFPYGSWELHGCITDSPEGSSLPIPMALKGGSRYNSVQNCTQACQDAGYYFAGVEAGIKCFCGQRGITVGGTDVDSGECEVLTCPGNRDEFCGGENRLLVYGLFD